MAKDYTVAVTINGKDNASKAFERVGKAAQKWMAMAAKAAIAAALAFGGLSMNWGMNFEAGMSSVSAVTRASAAEMAALTEKAKALGRESAFSATETGKAMEFLGMAGLKPGEILSAVGDTLNLAAAGSLDLGEAADIASNALTGFSLAADQMGRVSDVMADAAASSNTNVRQLGAALSYVGPQASAAGWSIESTVAAIGMMGNAGIQGSMAGTTLRQAITQLLAPTDEAYRAMRDLGISVVDSNGKMKSLESILRQIDPAIIGTADGLAKLTTVFGTRATPGIIALVKQGVDNFAAFKDQLETSGGAAEEMAKTKLDNLSGAVTLLKSSLEAVGIALVTGGEQSLTGGIKTFITDSLIPVINNTALWIEQLGGLPGLFKLVVAIAVMVFDKIKNAVRMLGDWDTFSTFVWSFGVALAGMILSFFQFGGNLILAIGDIAKVIWLPFIAPFSVMISGLMEKIVAFLNWTGEKFVAGANLILTPLRKIFDWVPELEWVDPLTYSAISMKDTWSAAWSEVGNSGDTAFDRMKTATKDLMQNMRVVFAEMDTVAGGLGLSVDDFKKEIALLIEEYRKFGNVSVEAIKKYKNELDDPPGPEDVAEELGPLGELWKAVSDAARHIPDAFKAGWEKYIDSIPKFIAQVEAHVGHMGLTITRELSNTFYDFMRTGKLTFKNLWNVIIDQSRQSFADMLAQTFMKSVIDKIVEKAVGWIVDLFKSGWDKIKGGAHDMWFGIASVPDGVTANLTTVLNNIRDNYFSTAFGAISGLSGDMWLSIATAPESIYTKLNGILDTIHDTVFAVKLDAIAALGYDMWMNIATAPGAAYTTINNILAAYRDEIFLNRFAEIESLGTDMWRGIASAPASVGTTIGTTLTSYHDDLFAVTFDDIVSLGTDMWMDIATAPGAAYTTINNILAAYRDEIFLNRFAEIEALGIDMWRGIASAPDDAFTKLAGSLNTMRDSVFVVKFDAISAIGRKMWMRIATAPGAAYTTINNILAAYRDEIFLNRFAEIEALGIDMWRGIATAPADAGTTIGATLNLYRDDIFHIAFDGINALGNAMWMKIGTAPVNAGTAITGTLINLRDTRFRPMFDNITAYGQSIWPNIAVIPNSVGVTLTANLNTLKANTFDGFFDNIILGAQNTWNNVVATFSSPLTITYSYQQVGGTPSLPAANPGSTIPSPNTSGNTGWIGSFLNWFAASSSKKEQLKAQKKLDKIYEDNDALITSGALTYNQAAEFQCNTGLAFDLIKYMGDKMGVEISSSLADALKTRWRWEGNMSLNDLFNTFNPHKDNYHTGGLLPGEGWFLGLKGEGVLNRTAMGMLGESGLRNLNEGRATTGETNVIVIQAWDGQDVERAIDNHLIPWLRDKSEAGVEVIHERGVKREVV